jgi:hypothetical protein
MLNEGRPTPHTASKGDLTWKGGEFRPSASDDRHLMRFKNYIIETVAGLVILVVGLAALGWGLRPLVFPLAPLAMVGINVFAIVEFCWIAILAGLIIFGIFKNKPGLILAPFIFHLCWFGASVASHRAFLAGLDPKVWSTAISEAAHRQRTLIADSYQIADRKIIADGHVDRLIKVKHDRSTTVQRTRSSISKKSPLQRAKNAHWRRSRRPPNCEMPGALKSASSRAI